MVMLQLTYAGNVLPGTCRVGVRRAAGFAVLVLMSYCSYKRVLGRSHTLEKRISMHPHKPYTACRMPPMSYCA